jgi:hypothetical protein
MNNPPPDPCIITMLRSPARLEPHTCNEAANEIERLRKERDEARLEVCKSEAMLHLQRYRVHRDSEEVLLKTKEIAMERGWDCFNTPEHKVVKTLTGVIKSKGKATPPEFLQDLG